MQRIVQHLVIFFLFTGMFTVLADSEKIRVLSTIKPIHLIVSEIAGNKADSEQLIPDYASPHSYSFKPSDIRKIKKAHLIFRIDEHLEAMLNSTLETHAPKNSLISLAEIEGITLLSLSKDKQHKHEDSADLHDESVDLHIWTSPDNILVMARSITASLVKLDMKNADTYKKNLEQFETSISTFTQNLKDDFTTLKDKPYFVFHNSWQYFSTYFDLKKPEIINQHEGLSGDIKSIRSARNKIKTDGIVCIFSGPNVSAARVKTLSENLDVNTAQIDVLASGIQAKKGSALEWLNSMSTTIKNCLTK